MTEKELIIAYVTALSAILTVIITFFLALSTRKYVKLTGQMVDEQNRPFVVVHIFAEDVSLLLSIKNIGNRPAKDVEIIFTPDLDIIIQKDNDSKPISESKPMLRQPFIPPSYDIRNLLYFGHDYFKRDDAGQHIFEIAVKYSDEQKKKYQESYTIDLGTFYYDTHVASFSDNHQFEQIHKEIKSLGENLVKAINSR